MRWWFIFRLPYTIVEKEENTKEMVEELEEFFPVFVFEVRTVEDALKMIVDLGNLTDRTRQAVELEQKIIDTFLRIPTCIDKARAAYVIWKNPYMVVGKNTYIQSLLEKLNFVNPFLEFEGRYPTVTEEDLRAANLDYLLLATEPYPFQEKHKHEFLQISPEANIKIVDGEMFWYGVKMLDAAKYFKEELLR